MAPTIDVVIPTHGGWRHTASCLRHLGEQTLPHRVILVDNASPDDTPSRAAIEFSRASVIKLDANRGFAAACNRGIGEGNGDVVVLLNNDVDCDPDFLEVAAAALLDAPTVGAVAPLLLRPGRNTIDSVGLAADVTLAGFPRLQGRPAREAVDERPRLLGPAGAAAVYRRRALEDVGALDERIFMYQEDLDLALRVRAAGWDAAAAPAAAAVHAGSATAQRGSAWQRKQGGFARGYVLRRYGVLRSRHAARALATEAAVMLGDLALSHDAAAARGRLAGWHAARRLARRAAPPATLEERISFGESMRLRRADRALVAANSREP